MFQGGINAAYGLNAIFMVESITAVSPSKKDERRRERESAERKEKKENLFADILDAQKDELRKAPAQYQTISYSRFGQRVVTMYQTREY